MGARLLIGVAETLSRSDVALGTGNGRADRCDAGDERDRDASGAEYRHARWADLLRTHRRRSVRAGRAVPGPGVRPSGDHVRDGRRQRAAQARLAPALIECRYRPRAGFSLVTRAAIQALLSLCGRFLVGVEAYALHTRGSPAGAVACSRAHGSGGIGDQPVRSPLARWSAGACRNQAATVTTIDVPSAIELTNGCTGAAATKFGIVQPDTPATTAPCTVLFASTRHGTASHRAARFDPYRDQPPRQLRRGDQWNRASSSAGRRRWNQHRCRGQ